MISPLLLRLFNLLDALHKEQSVAAGVFGRDDELVDWRRAADLINDFLRPTEAEIGRVRFDLGENVAWGAERSCEQLDIGYEERIPFLVARKQQRDDWASFGRFNLRVHETCHLHHGPEERSEMLGMVILCECDDGEEQGSGEACAGKSATREGTEHSDLLGVVSYRDGTSLMLNPLPSRAQSGLYPARENAL